jgi:hypothetical protein
LVSIIRLFITGGKPLYSSCGEYSIALMVMLSEPVGKLRTVGSRSTDVPVVVAEGGLQIDAGATILFIRQVFDPQGHRPVLCA